MNRFPTYDMKASSLVGDVPMIKKLTWNKSSDYDDTSTHTHKYCELLFFIDGSGTHELAYQKGEIFPCSIHVVNSGVSHRLQRSDQSNGFTLAFYGSAIIDEENRLLLDMLGRFNPFVSHMEEGRFQEILALTNSISWPTNGASNKSLIYLFNAIVEQVLDYVKTNKIIEFDKLDWFGHFLDYLSVHRDEKPRAFNLAKHLNISIEHLNSLCQSSFNCSTEELIAHYIIEHIKRDLMFSNKSVKALAYDNGFHDPSHFVKYFKKIEGRTPGQFRKSLL